MQRRFFVRASTLALATAAIVLTNCSTPETRISEHPDVYQSLSHRDQALISHGQIRTGMSRTAVWLAWGSPDRKIIGNMGGGPTETWVYIYYANRPYYPYAFMDEYFGAPLYDPFCYSWFPPSISYPGKLVTFAHGKTVSFQYVASP
jgi:outer membrane protein assembly factor BamE (lipoprotein component of BamABCDE complex)